MPGEDAAVGDDVVGDECIQIKVGQPGAMAEPLIGDPAGEILEDTELEIDARIERAAGDGRAASGSSRYPSHEWRRVGFVRNVPARAIEFQL